jgi:hypothetical protein
MGLLFCKFWGGYSMIGSRKSDDYCYEEKNLGLFCMKLVFCLRVYSCLILIPGLSELALELFILRLIIIL